jgi:hypothetical protein
MTETPLTLKEKYMLLAYHPETGRPLSQYLSFGLVGSILLELADMERFTLIGNRLVLSDATKISDSVLDLVVKEIARARSTKKVPAWINRFVRFRFRRLLKTMVLEEMIAKRVMKKEEARFLFIFKYFKYFPYETRTRNELIKNIRDMVLRKSEDEKDTYFLVALVGATFMTGKFFDKSERKLARKRIKEIIAESKVTKIARETVLAIKGAIVASIVSSSSAAAAASASGGSH